jgi:hypothetical protein
MTAPTSAVQKLQKDLANGAPSTHDPEPSSGIDYFVMMEFYRPKQPYEAESCQSGL